VFLISQKISHQNRDEKEKSKQANFPILAHGSRGRKENIHEKKREKYLFFTNTHINILANISSSEATK
jgi:hypothetical protein